MRSPVGVDSEGNPVFWKDEGRDVRNILDRLETGEQYGTRDDFVEIAVSLGADREKAAKVAENAHPTTALMYLGGLIAERLA